HRQSRCLYIVTFHDERGSLGLKGFPHFRQDRLHWSRVGNRAADRENAMITWHGSQIQVNRVARGNSLTNSRKMTTRDRNDYIDAVPKESRLCWMSEPRC